MKATILLLLATLSFSALAQEAGTYHASVDWNRIERGLKTGDFNCQGDCLVFKIDWKETGRVLSGQKYRETKKNNIAFCVTSLQNLKESRDTIVGLGTSGELAESETALYLEMNDNTVGGILSVCEKKIGKRQANNLRKNIFE